MLTTDRVAGAALCVLGLLVIVESRALPLGTLHNPGPAYMPVVLASLLMLFSVGLLVFGGGARRLAAVGWAEWRHAAAIFAVCAFAALALERVGYRLTIAAALAFLLGAVERKGLVFTAVFALGLALGTFFVFDTLLRVQLPRGPQGF